MYIPRDVTLPILEVGVLLKLQALYSLENFSDQIYSMFRVKDGNHAVLRTYLQILVMRILLKGCGR